MIKAYSGSVDSENECSALILEMSAISYRIKEDWTPELPEITIVTATAAFEKGMKIILVDATDATKQVMFYVKEIAYDYESRKYTLTCPHILEMLADVTVDEIPAPAPGTPFDDWSDVIPDYHQYNLQADYSGQGEWIWERQYYQAIFLIKMLIHYVSGVSVDTLDSTLIDDEDSFYKKTWESYGAQEEIYPYSELGMNLTAARYLGSSTNDQYEDPDFFVRESMLSCLDLLKYLLCALGIRIDIFREDYQMNVIASDDEPADADQIGRRDESIEQYRRYAVQRSGLDADPDYVWGYYDEFDVYHPYTWGVDDADKEILTSTAELENEEVTQAKQISVTFPNLFRIYHIAFDESNGYRSKIEVIDDAINSKTDWDHWLDAFYAWWYELSARNTYKAAMTALEMKWIASTMDIGALTMEYERLI